jgi:hypothetical protein
MTKKLLHRRGREETSLDEAQFDEKSKAHSGRFEDFTSGHPLYILDHTYCYTNPKISPIPEDFKPAAETDNSRDNSQAFGAFIPSTETDIFAGFTIFNFQLSQTCSSMHATDCKC